MFIKKEPEGEGVGELLLFFVNIGEDGGDSGEWSFLSIEGLVGVDLDESWREKKRRSTELFNWQIWFETDRVYLFNNNLFCLGFFFFFFLFYLEV